MFRIYRQGKISTQHIRLQQMLTRCLFLFRNTKQPTSFHSSKTRETTFSFESQQTTNFLWYESAMWSTSTSLQRLLKSVVFSAERFTYLTSSITTDKCSWSLQNGFVNERRFVNHAMRSFNFWIFLLFCITFWHKSWLGLCSSKKCIV